MLGLAKLEVYMRYQSIVLDNDCKVAQLRHYYAERLL